MATIVEGEPKAPFSIATTPRCREGASPFLGLLHFTFHTYGIILSVKQGRIKYHFFKKVFGMTRPGIEPRSPGPLANEYCRMSIGEWVLSNYCHWRMSIVELSIVELLSLSKWVLSKWVLSLSNEYCRIEYCRIIVIGEWVLSQLVPYACSHVLQQRKVLVSLFLMAYQPSWVIQCQSHHSKRREVVLFNK